MASETVEIFHQILGQCVEHGASDVLLKEDAAANLHMAGSLYPVDFVTTHEFLDTLLHEIMDARMMKEYDQNGDADFSYCVEELGRFRINAHKQRGMHGVTLRYVKSKISSIEELSLPPVLRSIAETPRGIILVCGTTGSGKSTTLAAMIQHINEKFTKHIITIEDPIEYEFRDGKSFVEQREVGLDCPSFYSALTHAMRQAPDVIMVGEMRDKESFEAALQAADTGHMVISTVHAADASQVVGRILDLYPIQEQDTILESLASNLKATVAQRLLPKALGKGVVPVVEVMICDPVVQRYISKKEFEKLPEAMESAREAGMQTFNMAILDRINNGEITEEVGLAASSSPTALKMNLKGIFLNSSK